MSQPTIRLLTPAGENPAKYRIVDGNKWCDFSVWTSNGVPDRRLGSYGGAAWPHEWPELFTTTGTPEWPNGTAQCPAGPMLTDAGMKLIGQV